MVHRCYHGELVDDGLIRRMTEVVVELPLRVEELLALHVVCPALRGLHGAGLLFAPRNLLGRLYLLVILPWLVSHLRLLLLWFSRQFLLMIALLLGTLSLLRPLQLHLTQGFLLGLLAC